MESLKDKVAIIGVGYTPQGRILGRSPLSFHVEAARNAIEDAGLRAGDIDGLLMQPPVPDDLQVLPWTIAHQLGLRLRFCDRQDEWGATASCMVFHAAAALVHGLADYVVCTYGESPIAEQGGAGGYGEARHDAVFGWYGATCGYAMAARRGMHELGTGPETWSQIAMAQRRWANLNPLAVMRDMPMTLEDYYKSKFIVEPFRLFDVCQVTNSGRAFVMTTAERARDCKQHPVYVMGMGQDHPGTDIIQAGFMAGGTGARKSGERALQMAGISLKDINACEIYDCFTYTVEITLMDYGFFKPGESKDFFAGGRTAPGGALPVNTSGGLLSEAYQQGFTPITEAVLQLQGRAGAHQLGPATGTREPEIILVSGNGGTLQTHGTVILRK